MLFLVHFITILLPRQFSLYPGYTESINQSFICIRPVVHIKDEKRNR